MAKLIRDTRFLLHAGQNKRPGFVLRPIPAILYKIGLVILSCLFAVAGFAQTVTEFSVKTDKGTVLLGEPIHLELKAFIPQGFDFNFFKIDSIPPFEIVKLGKIDTVSNASGTTLSQVITLTCFDSGSWKIPSFYIDSKTKTEPIGINVTYTPGFNPTAAEHGLKDIETTEQDPLKNNSYKLIIAVVLALAIIGIMLYKNRKSRRPPALQPAITPYDKAINTLNNLQFPQGSAKQFYQTIAGVLKEYCASVNAAITPDSTSEDVIEEIKIYPWQGNLLSMVADTLNTCSFVTFANYAPPAQEADIALQNIRNAINFIHQHLNSQQKNDL